MNDINQAQRAFLAWPILIEVAKETEPTITYGRLGKRIGVHPHAMPKLEI